MGIMTNAHDDFYHRLKQEALEDLAEIVADEPAETCRELRGHLAKALKFGDEYEMADAIIAVIKVQHAHNELKEHGTASAATAG